MADNEKNAVIILDSGKHFNVQSTVVEIESQIRAEQEKGASLPTSRSSMRVDERSGSTPTTSPCSTSTCQADQWLPSPDQRLKIEPSRWREVLSWPSGRS